MSTVRLVSNEELLAYRDMVSGLARRYDGQCGAEYDDLFQEGWMVCFLVLRKDRHPSKEFIAKRMLRWVSKCRQEGMTGYPNDEDVQFIRLSGLEEDALLD